MVRQAAKAGIFLFLAVASIPSRAQDPVEVELVPWANVNAAVDVAACGDGRLYIARQWGSITIVADSMTNLSPVFLDISTRTLYSGERGLLGLAFDPDHLNNGYFYVHYTANVSQYGTTRISRFQRNAINPNLADQSSEMVLLELVQPDPIHEGGGLVFGTDGYLYCALGDGGGSSDPNHYGQDPTTLFGTVIRIKPEMDGTYSIPLDNPFVGSPNGEREEIWAYGLRNPFRIGIDPLNNDLWIGDVGQERWEEIDRWPGGDSSGPNFGWSCYEADSVFNLVGCDMSTGRVFPVVGQAHSINGGQFCAIIAGEVYRGVQWSRLYGRYFYTDYCTGGIRTLTPDGLGGYVDQLALAIPFPGMSSIGTNDAGELFLTNVSIGKVFKLKDHCPMEPPEIIPDGNELGASSGETFSWFVDGVPFPDGNTQVINAYLTGTYTVEVTFASGCVKTSAPYFHLSTNSDLLTASAFSISPQPVSDVLGIRSLVSAPSQLSAQIVDMEGRALFEHRIIADHGNASIDVSALARGSYILRLVDVPGNAVARLRFVVAR